MNETMIDRGDPAAAFKQIDKGETSLVPATVFSAPAERVFGAQPVAVQRDETTILHKLKVMAGAAGDDWYYRFPVKNKDGGSDWIEGPSIKCANNVARLYGNCDIDVRVFDAGTSWMFYARFMDLETGYSLVRPFNQRKSQKVMKTDAGRAEDIVFQIGASKAIRNVINNALEFFSNYAMEEAKASIIEKVGKRLDYYRDKVNERLGELKIELKRVEAIRGRVLAQWIAGDVARTIAELQAINDGMATIDETYPLPAGAEGEKAEATTQSIGEKLDTLANGGTNSSGAAGSGDASQGGAASSQTRPGDAAPATTDQVSSQSPASPTGGGGVAADPAAPGAREGGTQTTSPAQSGAAAGGTAKTADDRWPANTEPKTEPEYRRYAQTWFADIGEKITIEEAQAKWKADKTLRNRISVTEEAREELKAEFDRIVATAKKAG